MYASFTADPVGLRERKKAESRAAIIQAALELYRERGFDSVTIDQIAERAGVARRTYFRYFATKEAVVVDRRLQQLAKFKELLASAPLTATALDVLRQAMKAIAEDYRVNRKRVLVERALFASSNALAGRDLQVDREFEQAIVEAVLARSGRSQASVRGAKLFAAAAMGVVRVLIDEWAESDGDLNLVRLGEPVIETIASLAPSHTPTARNSSRPASKSSKVEGAGAR
jgi:AcrR family transcriptional regulator